MDLTGHIRHYEPGGAGALSGATPYTIQGERGIFSAAQLQAAIWPDTNHHPRSRMVLVEQTSNMGGGSIWPLQTITEVCTLARSQGLARHMDGARLLNAVVATGIPAHEYAPHVDSVWIDFSKGLGAPVGAALTGSKEFIQRAWRWKHQFGGAMRQAGIIAAGALYALEHHVERLAEDHDNAQILAQGLGNTDGVDVEPVETNLVFFDIAHTGLTAAQLEEMLVQRGVRVSQAGPSRLRAVTHLDVSRAHIEIAVGTIQQVIGEERRT